MDAYVSDAEGRAVGDQDVYLLWHVAPYFLSFLRVVVEAHHFLHWDKGRAKDVESLNLNCLMVENSAVRLEFVELCEWIDLLFGSDFEILIHEFASFGVALECPIMVAWDYDFVFIG